MANNLWLELCMSDVIANRPGVPEIPAGTFCMFYATDTHALSIYAGGAWADIIAGVAPFQLPVMTVSGGTHNLPAAASGNKGQAAFVTDLNDIHIGATAAHGSTGAGIVVSNGTNWIVGGLPAQS